MLTSFLIFLFSLNVFSSEPYSNGVFEKKILSKSIKPKCEYIKGDETGTFSIEYSEPYAEHSFLVMRGLDPLTCKWHELEVKKLMKSSKELVLKGRGGSEHFENGNREFTWMWTYVKSTSKCHSYFVNDCTKN